MKFTIGIPAYKDKFLSKCINSILKQTYSNFEVVIVNDASPYDLKSIITAFSDKRIKYFENKVNFGSENVVDNWNKCLSLSDGDFFLLMGDDDELEPNYLAEFHNLILKYPLLDVYHCRTKLINENSEIINYTTALPEFETLEDNLWHRINFHRLQYVSDFLYRTSTLKQNNGYYKLPLAWASDDVTSYIAISDKGIAHINQPLLRYRVSNITISNSGNVDLKLKALEQEIKYIKSIVDNFKDSELKLLIKNSLEKYYNHRKRTTLLLQQSDNLLISSRRIFKDKVYKTTYKLKLVLQLIKHRIFN